MKQFIYFSAPWCGPCKMFGPIMERLAAEGIPVQKVNIDENRELQMQYRIMSVPTTVLVENGKEITRVIGAKSLHEMKQIYG